MSLLDLGGAGSELATLAAGRPALVFFYKGECAASDLAAGVLPRFAAISPRLAVIAASQDDPVATRAFAEAHGWSDVQVRCDREPWPASDAFGVRATPTWFLLDGSGAVVGAAEGWSRDDVNGLAREAARLAGAPPVDVAPGDGSLPAFRPG